jgi:hypothetical protein
MNRYNYASRSLTPLKRSVFMPCRTWSSIAGTW